MRLLIALLLIAAPVCAEVDKEYTDELNETRTKLICDIAKLHELNKSQAAVMLAIYEHELAPRKQMLTYSYFGVRRSMKPILEKCDSPEMEFLVCASICAGMIYLHCPNASKKSLKRFNHGYSKYSGWATDKKWWVYVYRNAKRWEKQNPEWLR